MNKGKVVLGMSGGTDSSMSAILLQEQGYEVTGVTFRFCEGGEENIADAVALARRLGIDHRIVDAREAFEAQILRYFTDEYLAGRTPVPCVLCNNRLKWPLLAAVADEIGARYIATGHYIRTQRDPMSGRIHIREGADPDKDQSFFMWGLPVALLDRMLLPLGDLTKTEVRRMAAERGFERVATKRDSMGVCFCPGDYRDFLRSRPEAAAIRPGDFVDTAGNRLGRHEGFPYYTVGQRRGLGVNFNRPMFVKAIDAAANRVVLAPLADTYGQTMLLKDVVVNYPDEVEGREVICRIRYRKQHTPAHVTLLPDARARVTFLEPVNAIAPGQSAVFYEADTVVGGGIIEREE